MSDKKEPDVKMNLHQKLLEIASKVLYFQKNTNGFNFKYTKGSELLAIIRPDMDRLGVLLEPVSVENAQMNRLLGKNKKGEDIIEYFYTADIIYEWVNTDDPKDRISIKRFVSSSHSDPAQAIGQAETYSERYFFLKYFHIATDSDDPDNYFKQNGISIPVAKISAQQLETINGLLDQTSDKLKTLEHLLNKYSVEDLIDLSGIQAVSVIDLLNLSLRKKQQQGETK